MSITHIEAGTRVGGRWRIIELIGEGGFGQVFRAVDDSSMALGDAAVKVLHPNTSPLERSVFTGEVQRMATLRHQNLVGYLDSGQMEIGHEVHSYLVAEFCTDSLEMYTRRQPTGRLETEDLLAVISDMSTGLSYLHSKSMIHRDIKPANVMFGDGAWKLGDFGLTRDLTETGSYHRGDSLRGTPLFMSPELFTTMTATAPSDVYALGVSAHLVATGRPVHQGSGQALIQNIMSMPPSVDPSLDPAVQDLIHRCTLIDPEQRITARDLRNLASSYVSSSRSIAIPSTPPPGRHPQPAAQPPTQSATPPQTQHYATAAQPFPAQQGVFAESRQDIQPAYHDPADAYESDNPYRVPADQQHRFRPAPKLTKPSKKPLVLSGLMALIVALIVGGAIWYTANSTTQLNTAAASDASDTPAIPGVEPTGTNSATDNALDGSDGAGSTQLVPLGNLDASSYTLDDGCQSGPGTLGTVTNNHSQPADFQVSVDHFDADGIKIGSGLSSVDALPPGQSSFVDFVSLEDGAATCQITEFKAEETPQTRTQYLDNIEITSCELNTFFGDFYDFSYVIQNPLSVPADIDFYVAVVGDDGVRAGEYSISSSEYGVPANGASKGDNSGFFSNVEHISNPPSNCVPIAVEVEAA